MPVPGVESTAAAIMDDGTGALVHYDRPPMASGETRADGSVPTPAERGHARAIVNRLAKRYPTIGTALDYASPYELLVSTVISAQTTDENVNKATPTLFSRWPTAADLAEASHEEVEKVIFSTGFYRQKTRSIIALAQDLVDKFSGIVPDTIPELVTLKGVGRKTASVVLAEAFKKPAIAVDTHVKRVSNRTGMTEHSDPVKIEQDLKALVRKDDWSQLSMRIIQYGRDVCDARKPSLLGVRPPQTLSLRRQDPSGRAESPDASPCLVSLDGGASPQSAVPVGSPSEDGEISSKCRLMALEGTWQRSHAPGDWRLATDTHEAAAMADVAGS